MNPPHIPATALGGDLIGGWTGPIEYQWAAGHWRAATLLGWPPFVENVSSGIDAGTVTIAEHRGRGRCVAVVVGCVESCTVRDSDIRLDPRRPEVAHRIVDVLRARGHEVGHLLPVALGGRQGDVTTEVLCIDCDGSGWHIADNAAPWGCPTCGGSEGANKGSGTIRRTIPAADVSAVLLAVSVAGVEAGHGVVRGVLSAWDDSHGVRWDRHGVAVAIGDNPIDDEFPDLPRSRTGWRVQTPAGNILAKGSETGPEGRAAADAALLRLGYAYLDPAAPFGVVVPTFDLENER